MNKQEIEWEIELMYERHNGVAEAKVDLDKSTVLLKLKQSIPYIICNIEIKDIQVES